jgi:uncharacterized membrane protein YccC
MTAIFVNKHFGFLLQPSGNIKLARRFKITSWFDPLLDNFTFDSSFFRHGLRLGIMTTIGVAIYSLAHIPQGNWLTITILVVLQPNFGGTFQRFFHRIHSILLIQRLFV